MLISFLYLKTESSAVVNLIKELSLYVGSKKKFFHYRETECKFMSEPNELSSYLNILPYFRWLSTRMWCWNCEKYFVKHVQWKQWSSWCMYWFWFQSSNRRRHNSSMSSGEQFITDLRESVASGRSNGRSKRSSRDRSRSRSHSRHRSSRGTHLQLC